MFPTPLLRPLDVVKALERLGWTVARQQGSHIIMVKKGHNATLSIPKHDQVARGTLRGLLHKAEIELDDFVKAVK